MQRYEFIRNKQARGTFFRSGRSRKVARTEYFRIFVPCNPELAGETTSPHPPDFGKHKDP